MIEVPLASADPTQSGAADSQFTNQKVIITVLFGSNLPVFRWHRAFTSPSRAGRQDAEACGHWACRQGGLQVLRAVQLWESKGHE